MRQQRSPRRGRPRAHSRPDRSVSSPAFESSSVEQSSDDGTVKQCNNDSENATSPLGDNRTADTLKVGERRTRSERYFALCNNIDFTFFFPLIFPASFSSARACLWAITCVRPMVNLLINNPTFHWHRVVYVCVHLIPT